MTAAVTPRHATGTGTARSAGRRGGALIGLAVCLRIAWRRSRLFWTVWVLGLATLMPATVSKYHDLVPEGQDNTAMLTGLAANPTMRALLGPPYDLTQPGGFAMWRVGTFIAAAAAMMATLGVIRATRAEEEPGRLELVRSGAVARHAALAAAVTLSLLGCLAVTLLTTLGLVVAKTPVAGALTAGLGIGLTGAVFVGVGAVCAQIFESARAARAWSLGLVLGGLYLVRAVIDGSGSSGWEWTRWLVPLEWAALARPFAGERWWVLGLPAALTLGLVGLAFFLEGHRDHSAGLRAARRGRAGASSFLSGPAGLAWRLQRAGVIGWTAGLLVTAVGIGSMGKSMSATVSSNPQVADMLRKMGGSGQLTQAFFMAMLSILAPIVGLAGVMMLGRLQGEESAGHAENLLATGITRWSLALSHLTLALVAPGLLLVGCGVLLPLLQASADGTWGLVGHYTLAALVFLAGLVLVVGFAMFLLGWVPRLFALAWAVIGWTIFTSWLGSVLGLPDWLTRLHPWGHLPHLPAEAMSWTPVLVETGVGLALLVIGLVGYRRRDLQCR